LQALVLRNARLHRGPKIQDLLQRLFFVLSGPSLSIRILLTRIGFVPIFLLSSLVVFIAAVGAVRVRKFDTVLREIMTEHSSWTGCAADLLRAGADRSSDGISSDSTGWPKNPRALAGRLRRAQTFLRALGIEVAFGREGRAGSRIIRMHTTLENNTVSSIGHNGAGSAQAAPGAVCDDNAQPDLMGLMGTCSPGHGRRRCGRC
jgi:hypothetical protein